MFADAMASAFGADFSGAASGERAIIQVLGAGNTVLASAILTDGVDDFFGFTADGGDAIAGIRIVGMGDGNATGGEGFYIDNVAGVTVPAPAPMMLALLAGCGAVTRRR